VKRGIVVLLALVLLLGGILVGCGPAEGTAEWHAAQADELNNQGRHDEAIDHCNEAIELDPNCVEAYNERAYAYNTKG